MIISLGKYVNHLGRPNVITAMNPAASSKFPAKNLYDSAPAKYMQFGAVPTAGIDGGTLNRTGVIILNLLKNPGAETSVTGWKRGGTVAATAAQFYAGTKSWQIAADAYLYQDILVRSGEYMRISGATRGDGVAALAFFGVMNIDTGQALSTTGTWVAGDREIGTGTSKVATVKKLGSQTAAAWISTSIPFTVEPYSSTLKHLTRLRIVVSCSGAGNGFVDDVWLVPGTDLCSLHGFNFPANMLVAVDSSETGAFAGEETDRFSLTPFQPSFYQWLGAPFLARYLKFTLLGVRERLFLPYIGELIFTQVVHLEISSRFASAMRTEWLGTAKIKNAAQADKALASPSRPVRTLNLPFRWVTEAQYDEAREWFVLRSRGDGEEILIAEPVLDAEFVIYGRLSGPRGFSIQAPDVRDSESIIISEKDLPKPPKGEEI